MVNERINMAVRILTLLSAVAASISGSFEFLLPLYVAYKFKMSLNENSTIGIIGGADGPTAVFVTKQSSHISITLILLVIAILGTAYQIYTKRINKIK